MDLRQSIMMSEECRGGMLFYILELSIDQVIELSVASQDIVQRNIPSCSQYNQLHVSGVMTAVNENLNRQLALNKLVSLKSPLINLPNNLSKLLTLR